MSNRKITNAEEKFCLTARELQVLEVLWSNECSLTALEIYDLSLDSSWHKNSIHSFLVGLRDKGAVFEAEYVRTEKRLAIKFAPTYSREEYQISHLKDSTRFAQIKPSSLPGIFAALIEGDDINESVLSQLETILKEKRKDIK